MKILILGGGGMLWHQLYKSLSPRHDVRTTLHRNFTDYLPYKLFSKETTYCNVDVRDQERLAKIFLDFIPKAVINAVGIIKQRANVQAIPTANGFSTRRRGASNRSVCGIREDSEQRWQQSEKFIREEYIIPSIEINALFPHQISILCKTIKARLVHLSTDCVFSGNRGNYKETDTSDATDIYGKTKALGELCNELHAITLRTSIIGFELKQKASLLEWLLAQKQRIKGFKNAVFSGFTTNELSRIIEKILTDFPNKYGLYHVASQPISKLDLLTLINQKFGLDLEITPDETVKCYRQLNGERFNKEFYYTPPSWPKMIDELAKIYQNIKR